MNIKKILKHEISLGTLLLVCFVLAIIISNSPLDPYYLEFISLPIVIKIGTIKTETTFLHVVNDALMTLFFLLIGLELKYHLVHGEYKNKRKTLLPAAAAVGGFIVPILIFSYFNYGETSQNGWAIPIATDTAFVLGILSFFKRKISNDLRAFILGFSLFDDILAVIVLAVFYTNHIDLFALLIAALFVMLLFLLNYYTIKKIHYYLLTGMFLWIALVKAGIHGTLAGIIVAFFIPLEEKHNDVSMFNKLENSISPVVNWFVLPLFVLINSEMTINEVSFNFILNSLELGIIGGLFFGKQIGIALFSYVMIKMKFCKLPEYTNWGQYYAICILGGIGFTISIFIGNIAFTDYVSIIEMRSSIVVASLASATIGCTFLYYSVAKHHTAKTE